VTTKSGIRKCRKNVEDKESPKPSTISASYLALDVDVCFISFVKQSNKHSEDSPLFRIKGYLGRNKIK
jgi:hypothetical protein